MHLEFDQEKGQFDYLAREPLEPCPSVLDEP